MIVEATFKQFRLVNLDQFEDGPYQVQEQTVTGEWLPIADMRTGWMARHTWHAVIVGAAR